MSGYDCGCTVMPGGLIDIACQKHMAWARNMAPALVDRKARKPGDSRQSHDMVASADMTLLSRKLDAIAGSLVEISNTLQLIRKDGLVIYRGEV